MVRFSQEGSKEPSPQKQKHGSETTNNILKFAHPSQCFEPPCDPNSSRQNTGDHWKTDPPRYCVAVCHYWYSLKMIDTIIIYCSNLYEVLSMMDLQWLSLRITLLIFTIYPGMAYNQSQWHLKTFIHRLYRTFLGRCGACMCMPCPTFHGKS